MAATAAFQSLLLIILTTLTMFANNAAGFSVTFPSSPDYWTACKTNTLKWTLNQTESDIFSVALLNTNTTLLNGNYQIANSVPSSNGTFKIHLNCVEPSDGYYLNFVNSSHYSLNNPQVYYTSPIFTIKDNSSTVLTGASAASGLETSSGSSSSSNSSTSSQSNPYQAANPAISPVMDSNKKNSAFNLQSSVSSVILLSLAMGVMLIV